MVFEHQHEYDSQWATIESIAIQSLNCVFIAICFTHLSDQRQCDNRNN